MQSAHAELDILVVVCNLPLPSASSQSCQGTGGGPLETDLSCYLVKPSTSSWTAGCVALEGGSGVGALQDLLVTKAASFADFGLPSSDPAESAFAILELIRSYVITHAHLDHIAGLCISAGTAKAPKPLYGSPTTLKNMGSIFNGGIWPPLASREAGPGMAYLYRPIDPGGPAAEVGAGLSVRAMPLSHGCVANDTYESTAFFVSVSGSQKQLLFFGDVEPDSISGRPQNSEIWQQAAGLFRDGNLLAVVIECSFATSRPDNLLFGHLTPAHLLDELTNFANVVCPSPCARPLHGLRVFVTHIKRTPGTFEQVTRELADIELTQTLGIQLVPLQRGMRLSV